MYNIKDSEKSRDYLIITVAKDKLNNKKMSISRKKSTFR